MIVTICYFLKLIKSPFTLVQCNTLLSKIYVAHPITVVCVIGWIWKKTFVCALWLSVHMKSVVEPGFALNSHLTTKYWYLKHASNFEYVENIQSSNNVKFKFKLLVFRTLLYRFLWPTSSSVILNACLCLCVIFSFNPAAGCHVNKRIVLYCIKLQTKKTAAHTFSTYLCWNKVMYSKLYAESVLQCKRQFARNGQIS